MPEARTISPNYSRLSICQIFLFLETLLQLCFPSLSNLYQRTRKVNWIFTKGFLLMQIQNEKKKGLKRFFFGEILLFYAYVNTFAPNVPFLYPLKTLENHTIFWCFQGVQKGCIGNKWVKAWFCNNNYPIILNQLPSINQDTNFMQKRKNFKFGTKNTSFWYFWAVILKNFFHVWNHHSRINENFIQN